MDDRALREVIGKICSLQPFYSHENTPEMAERGRLIRSDLASIFQNEEKSLAPLLDSYGNDFTVNASDGIGRKTEAPWVRFASKRMSHSPREGYYFVIHFAKNGKSFFLTIGCGATIWDGRSLELAQSLLIQAGINIDDYLDPIELGAEAKVPKSFERATVLAKKIRIEEIHTADLQLHIQNLCGFLQTIYQGQEAGFDLTPVEQYQIETEKKASTNYSSGQGYSLSAAEKRAVELRAMTVTKDWFESKGYGMIDTSARESFDFLAEKNGKEIKVEVKGTTSFKPNSVLMTRREVDLHKNERGQTALAIVSEISLKKGQNPIASFGKIDVFIGWDIDDWELEPTAYKVSKKNIFTD